MSERARQINPAATLDARLLSDNDAAPSSERPQLYKPMNLERKKGDRRERIIAAAEELIRETGSTDFSMNALAARAGFSTPTTYNLIGSKATVLYTLLNSYQDNIDRRSALKRRSRDPYQSVIRAADDAVDVYTADAQFIKPLMQFLIGVVEPDHRTLFMNRGYNYWKNAMHLFVERQILTEQSCRVIAKDFVIYFTGIIDFWVQDELSDAHFRAVARYGSLLRLVGFATGEDRAPLLRKLADYELDVVRHSQDLV